MKIIDISVSCQKYKKEKNTCHTCKHSRINKHCGSGGESNYVCRDQKQQKKFHTFCFKESFYMYLVLLRILHNFKFYKKMVHVNINLVKIIHGALG